LSHQPRSLLCAGPYAVSMPAVEASPGRSGCVDWRVQ
jgi:hypothetical protein